MTDKIAGTDGDGHILEEFLDGGFVVDEGIGAAEVFDEPVPFEGEDIDGFGDEFFEGVFAGGEDEIAGVFALRDGGDFDIDFLGEADFECAVGGFEAGGVAIENQDDFFGVAAQDSGVAVGETCAEGGDDICAAELMRHNAIGVAFDDYGGGG